MKSPKKRIISLKEVIHIDLLIRLLVGIGIIWLVQTLLAAFELKDPANKIVFVVTILLVIIWLVSGQTVFLK